MSTAGRPSVLPHAVAASAVPTRAVFALTGALAAAVAMTATVYMIATQTRRRRRRRTEEEDATSAPSGAADASTSASTPRSDRDNERRSPTTASRPLASVGASASALHVQAAESAAAAATPSDPSPPGAPPAVHLDRLSRSVPFLSSSIRLHSFEGRGIGFLATRAIEPGELLLIDTVLDAPTDDRLAYDWAAHAELVRQMHERFPEALDVLYVGADSQTEIDEDHPLPMELTRSPLPGVSDEQWKQWLHAVANNAYLREKDEDEDDSACPPSASVGATNPFATPTRPGAAADPSSSTAARPSTSPAAAASCEMVLLLLTCKLNHSCHPNAASSNGRVYSVDLIQPGDEVTVSYLLPEQGLYLPTAKRREMLRASRHFECACDRCQGATRTMREIEAAVTDHALDSDALAALEEQISALVKDDSEEDQDDSSTNTPEWRQLAATLSSLYSSLPASHWLRYLPRRRLLLSPPPWLVCQPGVYLRLLLEHWSVTQLLLPTHHLYRVLEVEELAQAIDRHQRLTRADFRRLFLRLEPDAFADESPLARMDNESVRTIMKRRFQSPESPSGCSVVDCPNALGGPHGEDDSPASRPGRPLASTFVCAHCDMPLVACSSQCHFALVQYHQEICDLLALTKG